MKFSPVKFSLMYGFDPVTNAVGEVKTIESTIYNIDCRFNTILEFASFY